MFWRASDIEETLRMVESQQLDIRTITLGISLLDAASDDVKRTAQRVYEKIVRCAEGLARAVADVQDLYGIPIVNKRIAVTPVALVAQGSGFTGYEAIAQEMERAAQQLGIDYIGGYSALVHKGATPGDLALIESIPGVLANTERVCCSVNVASTRAGINMNGVLKMAEIVLQIAQATASRGAIGCARFVVFANAVEDNPFIAGAFHGVGEPDCVINVGVSGPGVVLAALRQYKETTQGKIDLSQLAEVIKRMSFKITRAGELVGRRVAERLQDANVRFGIVDLSLAPTPAVGDSVANILEALGLERTGAPGSTAALALLTDAVKKGGAMASSSVGGLSGAFIPVSEDKGMIDAVTAGALGLEKLEAMMSVCSVGLDMIAIPGDTPMTTIAGIMADAMAVGVMNNKTIGVRIIPVPGKAVGDRVVYGGLLGEAPIMAVNRFGCAEFVSFGGRIPPPIQSMTN